MGCTEPADLQLKVKADAKYGIECPAGCFKQHATMQHDLWGNPLFGYTKDSSICLAAMHADLLADNETNYVIIEFFETQKTLFKCNYTVQGIRVPCKHRGIEAQSKQGTFGFKFVDSLLSCKYFKIKKDKLPFMEKVKLVKGKDDWKEEFDEVLGLVVKPPSKKDESVVIFKDFECGNAKILFNVRIIEFNPENVED